MLSRTSKVVHEIIAKHLPRNTLLARKPRRRLFQVLGQALALVVCTSNILAASKRRNGQLELLLDTPPAKSQNCCKNKVAVGVCSGHADFEASALGWAGGWCDEANGSGAVLKTPRDGHWCPEVLDKALVAVDGGCDYRHDVGKALKKTRQEMATQVAQVFHIRVW